MVQRIPKEVFVDRTLEFGVYDAVSHFNIGSDAVIEAFNSMNIFTGKHTEIACQAEVKTISLVLPLLNMKVYPRLKREERSYNY